MTVPPPREKELIMKPLTIALTLIMIFSSGPALARGPSGGSHGSGAHSRGAHFSGGHYRGSHYGGRHHWGSRVGVGVFIGAPAFGYGPYWYDPYPYGYYPPAVIVPSSPPTYIEQGEAQASDWWYYCPDSKTYYPYVKECPGGWQTVVPQPPAPS